MNVFASFHSVLEPIIYYNSVVDPHRFCSAAFKSKRTKVTLENRKNVKFHELNCWMFSFESSYSLDVLHRGPRDKKNSRWNLVIKTLDPDLDPHWDQYGSTNLVYFVLASSYLPFLLRNSAQPVGNFSKWKICATFGWLIKLQGEYRILFYEVFIPLTDKSLNWVQLV